MINCLIFSLKNIFSIHLLESEIELRDIQGLLSHKSSKTIERYTHVSTKNISSIKNPLDNLLGSVKYGERNNE
ncbi:tyrosine-type recombinase/integrase [Deferribacter desulfuricans]|uniref:tyrosine-type recombinase/integrase n=1 Tax=Deferribacter desulfuricans TaxID=197162 RepID=UPI000A03FEA5